MVERVHRVHFLHEVLKHPGHAQHVVLQNLHGDGNLRCEEGRRDDSSSRVDIIIYSIPYVASLVLYTVFDLISEQAA